MKSAQDLIPWTVRDLGLRPYDGFWSMNPSICFDGQQWLCVLRCVDYAMPNGVTIRSPKAGPGHQTKNAMVILDPQTWQPIKICKMHERDDHPRAPTPNVGYEDMRIFKTDRGGLQGIAASLHLKRDTKPAAGGAQHQPPEQVLLSFDDEYNIVSAKPIRGDHSGTAQKNWAPFSGAIDPRFLYAIDRGTIFDDRGPVHGEAAVVRVSAQGRELTARVQPTQPTEAAPETPREQEPPQEPEREPEREPEKKAVKKSHPDRRVRAHSGGDVLVRGRRVVADTLASRPSSRPSAPRTTTSRSSESTRVLGTGRALPPKYAGLRGGTQLLCVADDTWLGIGHSMTFVKSRKYYWHVIYCTNARGKMLSVSEPIKLASEGIEFAAGMAIDGDRVVVSFGVDDMHCRLGETSLSAVMGILRPVEH